jgi:high-affinity iron transporter
LPRAPTALLLLVLPATALAALPAGPPGPPGSRPGTATAASASADDLRRILHLLDYLAVDYPPTVRDGAVTNEVEYGEQLEFAGQVRERIERLGLADQDPIRGAAAGLEESIRARASGADVTAHAHALADEVRTRFAVQDLPVHPPDPSRGRALFGEACASCHGAQGRGDGPAAHGLAPPPANLTDAARMRGLSPFALYSTITYGIPGTAMAPFAGRLDDAARWDLAFYAATLSAPPGAVERGRILATDDPTRSARVVPSLQTLVEQAPAALAGSDAAHADLVAYLLAHPEALEGRALPLAVARARLADSWHAYGEGDPTRAVDLAVSAYLDGFEPVEPALATLDPALRRDAEAAFFRYREALRRRRPAGEVEPLYRAVLAALDQAESRLAGGALGPTAAFVSALTILAREGLEAVLLVVAIATVLSRAGRRDALPWVHAGWIGALVAGGITWWAAGRLIDLSGARREVVEGLSALLASAILFYVSYWLVSKVEATRWQAFLGGRIREAVSTGRLGALAALSFVAVYRECFETVLFYEALGAQAGPEGAHAVAAGVGAGALVLAVLATAVFRFGQRMPMRRFFTASSLLLYGLCVVLAGHGVAALQEAAWLPVTPVPFPSVDWLGVHPTLQGLAAQGALVVAALAAFVKLSGGLRRTWSGAGNPREGSRG